MDKHKKMKFETKLMHGGSKGPNPERALNPPIFMTSTFTFDSTKDVQKVMNFESDDYVYTRGNNPTLRLLENRMAELEGGAGAVAFASGMAAISSVLFSLLKPGDKVIGHRTLYGSTHTVLTQLLPKYGVEGAIVNLTNIDELELAIDDQVKVIYFETPSNPNLEIVDIRAVCEIAHKHDIKVVIDNTFATPFLQRPLELGADVVVHSATKYICGHGDVVAGIAVAKEIDYVHQLKFEYMCEFGGAMSPFNGWLLLRGLKTLAVRMRQHCANTAKVAHFLREHPRVKSVYWPGFEDFPGHKVAKSQMKDFGAIISFEIEGTLEEAETVVNNTKLAQLAVSLGDCETLIELPAAMTHLGYDRSELETFGLTETMIRISVGIEDPEDIIADIRSALDA